jgi:hypothetical protein
MAVLAAATRDAAALVAGQHETEKGAELTVAPAEVEPIIADWPEAAQLGVRQLLAQYGPPNEATPTKLMWYGTGPWKRTVLTSDEVLHNFPSPHADFLTQWIDYRVPVDKFDVLARYDGSCLVDRTTGEAGARCDSEAANMLTLDLMHDLVTGTRTVEDARSFYSETMAAYALGCPAPYCEGFQFELPRGGTEDPDQPVIEGPLMREAVKKVTQEVAGGVVRGAVRKVKDALTGDE